MLNTVVLIGRLTQDPAMRYTPNGVAVASFTVAVDRPFTDQNGQRETDFIDCLAWRKLGETVANHLKKGRLVAVQGRLHIRSYEAKDGTKRRVAEVVADTVRFLDRGPKEAAGASTDGEGMVDLPDDLPF
jgi:single-strand DNA-binding protein